MATHSSTLAWELPWTEEPGGLQSLESQKKRVRQGFAVKQTNKAIHTSYLNVKSHPTSALQLFFPDLGPNRSSCALFSCHIFLVSFNLDSFSTFLSFMTLKFWSVKSIYFVGCLSVWDFSDVSSWLDLWLGNFGKNTADVMLSPSHYVISRDACHGFVWILIRLY